MTFYEKKRITFYDVKFRILYSFLSHQHRYYYFLFKPEEFDFKLSENIICFGFKKTNREISTAGGEVIYLFF